MPAFTVAPASIQFVVLWPSATLLAERILGDGRPNGKVPEEGGVVHVIWTVLRLLSAAAGLFLLLLVFVSREREESRVDALLMRLWIAVDDLKKRGLTTQAAVIRGAVQVTNYVLDRVYGPRLMSLRAAWLATTDASHQAKKRSTTIGLHQHAGRVGTQIRRRERVLPHRLDERAHQLGRTPSASIPRSRRRQSKDELELILG
jgi:hypothetical protein